jgi:hypothetical protein
MRTFVLTTVFALAVACFALAGPKDKSQETLIDPSSVDGNGTTWDNKTVTGKVKTGGCKLQIQFKDAKAAIEGQNVICLGEADVIADLLPPPGAGNTIVTRGIVSGGKLKIKGKMAAVGCGVISDAINFNATTTCYQEDPTWDPAVECPASGSLGMLWIEPSGFKEDSVEGLCQGLVLGDRINPPSSPVLAIQGALQPLQ